ncbi:hypothetical protein K435DRAFT_970853 [Dendrothele bispora CBS 962.96]|uniref:Family A G protein-coupled receptor-like protein n=1 Tax=Dendrothele bispora (strain CBS 962.96) TaxID=1314807 RepID=A0A4S8L8R9_DENBC|nr:hypothetical protein K435DRAFT_970853 [Dendrothele bispora CBS 962.96]
MQQSRPLTESDIIATELWIAPTAVIALLYGVHLVLSILTLGLLLKSGLKKKAHVGLFILTILTMIGSTFNAVLDLEFKLLEASLRGQHHPDLNSTLDLANKISIGQNYTDRLNFLISDAIVVWRAWVLFPRSRKVKVILALCMVISTAGTYLEAAFITSRAVGLKDFKLAQRKIFLMPICVLLTNVTATFLIGYKACCHHMTIKRNLDKTDRSVDQIRKILVFLAESGVVYCVLWIIYAAIILFAGNETSISYGIYNTAMPDISGIYPILIILLVAHENNVKEQENHNVTLSQSIRFASAPRANSDSEGDISEVGSSSTSGKAERSFENTSGSVFVEGSNGKRSDQSSSF